MRLFIPLLIFSFNCTAQTLFIRGVVREAKTDAAIPYASILILNTTKGTAADDQGNFMIRIDDAQKTPSIKISAIGFVTKIIPVQALANQNLNVISLEAQIHMLNEFVLEEKAISPKEIALKAIESMNKNYRQQHFNLEFYSEMKATDKMTSKEYKVESILLGYYKGYSNRSEKKFEILQRRSTGEDILRSNGYPYWPALELYWADQVSSEVGAGVLNPKHTDKFDFQYGGANVFDDDTVYVINYVLPKPNKQITGFGIVPKIYKGTILITVNENAIVKHEIETDDFSYNIIYTKIEGAYYPYLIGGQRRKTGGNPWTVVDNRITLTNIETNDVKVIDKGNAFGNLNTVPQDQSYWDTHFPVD